MITFKKYGDNSRLLFTDTDSLMSEIKDDSNDKKMFDFSNYLTKSKYYNNSNKLVVAKMKDETAGAAIEEFFGLNSKMYSHLVNNNSEHKKAKCVNKNVVATISHNECKDVLLNKKCLRHSMNRIQTKHHKIGTYEISKTSLSCFDDEIYIQSNRCDGLALVY